MENVRKHRDIKLVPTEKRKNYFLSDPNYHKTIFFSEKPLTIEMRKTHILMNKQVSYFGLLILDFDYLKLILRLRETKM